MLKIAAIVSVAVLCAPALAGKLRDVPGKTYSWDPETKLAWMDPVRTINFSFVGLAAGDAGLIPQGWRFARSHEVTKLLRDNLPELRTNAAPPYDREYPEWTSVPYPGSYTVDGSQGGSGMGHYLATFIRVMGGPTYPGGTHFCARIGRAMSASYGDYPVLAGKVYYADISGYQGVNAEIRTTFGIPAGARVTGCGSFLVKKMNTP